MLEYNEVVTFSNTNKFSSLSHYIFSHILICLNLIMPAAYCPDESTDLLRGHYNWTEREAELSQTLPCQYKGTVTEGGCDITEANATRLCNEYGRWEKPNVSRCISEVTAMLCNVRNVRDSIYTGCRVILIS